MPLSLTCDCGARFEVEDALAGQTVSCPECQAALKAPPARRPVVRTSNFALASFLLAVVGAFTVVGTIAAVVLGILGVASILRDRERLAGLGFAVTGIILGAAFTALTLFSLSQVEFFAGTVRRSMITGQLDRAADPTKVVEVRENGFHITKPVNWARVAEPKEFQFPPAQPLLRDDAKLLLVQLDTGAFVDVDVDSGGVVGDIDDYILNRIKPEAGNENGNAKPRGLEAEERGRIQDRKLLSSRKVGEAHELTVKVKLDNKDWTMVVRTYPTSDGKLFIVRGFMKSATYDQDPRAREDLLNVLDSFQVAPGF